ncbi:Do family serine endopeptidase [Candidatus Sumerlaeota bacterium]|nr:Do family serine endopeptidase [Candidatus Sumerlaeota bacterium]
MRKLSAALWMCAIVTALWVGQSVAPALAVAPGSAQLLRTMGEEIAQIAEKAQPSVVSIHATSIREEKASSSDDMQKQFEEFFGPFGPQFRFRLPDLPDKRREDALGSGFIIDPKGIILTNNHVVADMDRLEVIMSDGAKYPAKVLGADPESEVAVVKIEAKGLPALELGDSDDLKVGHFVIGVGSPMGLSRTVTFGIVSALDRSEVRVTSFANFIQTDAAINRGNSGGPLLDADGKAVGVNTFIVTTSGGSEGLGFSIPINQAKAVADQLIKYGKVERGYLGVKIGELTPEAAEHLDTGDRKGAIVEEVFEDKPAAKAGLRSGDAIVAIEGKPVKSMNDVLNKIASYAPGEKINLTVVRHGKEKKISAELALRPSQKDLTDQMQDRGPRSGSDDKVEIESIGMGVRTLDSDTAEKAGFSGEKGVLITNVDVAGKAYEIGLKPGMVIQEANGMEIQGVEDLRKALETGKDKRTVMLRILDRTGSQLVFLPRK